MRLWQRLQYPRMQQMLQAADGRWVVGLCVGGLLLCLSWLVYDRWRFAVLLDRPRPVQSASVADQHSARDPARIAAMFRVPLHDGQATVSTAALTLVASIVASDPAASSALIAGVDGTRRYRVGQTIEVHGQLRKIAADHVVILRNGQEELLRFARAENRLLLPYQLEMNDPVPALSNTLLRPYQASDSAAALSVAGVPIKPDQTSAAPISVAL